LIVEDDAVLRKHLTRLFEREGYSVSTATSCAAAAQQLAVASFEVLLLDIHLPDGNGLDLLGKVGTGGYPHLVVAMTALSTDESELRAQCSSVCRLLRKPIDLLQLLETVRGRMVLSAELLAGGRTRQPAAPQRGADHRKDAGRRP